MWERKLIREITILALLAGCTGQVTPTEIVATSTSSVEREIKLNGTATVTATPTATRPPETSVTSTPPTKSIVESTATPEATAVPVSPEYVLDGPVGMGVGYSMSPEQREDADRQWNLYRPYIEEMIKAEYYSGSVDVNNPTGIVAAVCKQDDRVVVYPKIWGGERDGTIILPIGSTFSTEGIQVPEMPENWDPSQVIELSKGDGERVYYDYGFETVVRADGEGSIVETWNNGDGVWDEVRIYPDWASKEFRVQIDVAEAAWTGGGFTQVLEDNGGVIVAGKDNGERTHVWDVSEQKWRELGLIDPLRMGWSSEEDPSAENASSRVVIEITGGMTNRSSNALVGFEANSRAVIDDDGIERAGYDRVANAVTYVVDSLGGVVKPNLVIGQDGNVTVNSDQPKVSFNPSVPVRLIIIDGTGISLARKYDRGNVTTGYGVDPTTGGLVVMVALSSVVQPKWMIGNLMHALMETYYGQIITPELYSDSFYDEVFWKRFAGMDMSEAKTEDDLNKLPLIPMQ